MGKRNRKIDFFFFFWGLLWKGPHDVSSNFCMLRVFVPFYGKSLHFLTYLPTCTWMDGKRSVTQSNYITNFVNYLAMNLLCSSGLYIQLFYEANFPLQVVLIPNLKRTVHPLRLFWSQLHLPSSADSKSRKDSAPLASYKVMESKFNILEVTL